VTYYEMQAPIRKKTPAIVAAIALFLVGAISIGGFHAFGSRYGFGFLPILVLAIWPRYASPLLSIALVFCAGFFVDWATGGILGQWALIFVVIWGVLRPEMRSAPYAVFSILFYLISGL